jgi:hypothetical protein
LQQFSVFPIRSTGTGWKPQNARNEPRPIAPDDHESAHRQSISPTGSTSAREENIVYVSLQRADLVNGSYPTRAVEKFMKKHDCIGAFIATLPSFDDISAEDLTYEQHIRSIFQAHRFDCVWRRMISKLVSNLKLFQYKTGIVPTDVRCSEHRSRID